jgi:ribosomal protein S27AE
MAENNTRQLCPHCGSDQTTIQIIDRSERYFGDLTGGPGATHIIILFSMSCGACGYHGEHRVTGWRQGR